AQPRQGRRRRGGRQSAMVAALRLAGGGRSHRRRTGTAPRLRTAGVADAVAGRRKRGRRTRPARPAPRLTHREHPPMALQRIAALSLSLPRVVTRIIVLGVDASLCILTVWLAYYLRLDQWIPLSGHATFRPLISALGAVALALPIFIVFGLYRAIFRYAGSASMLTVLQACTVYGVLYAAIFTAFGIPGVPRSIGLLQPVLLLLAVTASRAVAHVWLGGLYRLRLRELPARKVLIYGAGSSGRQLAAALADNREMRLLGFLDDDPRLHGQLLN